MAVGTRDFVDGTLDLDRSKGVPHDDVIAEFRFVKLLGVVYEQVACDVFTGDAIFELRA